jgi:hypothetical protein
VSLIKSLQIFELTVQNTEPRREIDQMLMTIIVSCIIHNTLFLLLFLLGRFLLINIVMEMHIDHSESAV